MRCTRVVPTWVCIVDTVRHAGYYLRGTRWVSCFWEPLLTVLLLLLVFLEVSLRRVSPTFGVRKRGVFRRVFSSFGVPGRGVFRRVFSSFLVFLGGCL